MNLVVSFSGRKNGNCDSIADYIAEEQDEVVYMREVSTQPCADCDYQCMRTACKYQEDGIYALFEKMSGAEKIFYVVPMYCGNPSALYYILNERSQGYFMRNMKLYEEITEKLRIVGIYGNHTDDPEFMNGFERDYHFENREQHLLGLERHRYGHKMRDFLLNEKEVRDKIDQFIRR